ncbi:MAG: MoxR family ATPase [Alicyclobacillus sp.]|nr:MoxR family ATPase [Alicyclobacillus sp.]
MALSYTLETPPLHEPLRPELQAVVSRVEQVLVGKPEVVRLVLVALLAGGHCLIEDVPGVGKTTLVRAVARALGCEFKRIQFTPDLLPADVTGVSVYNQKSQTFEFRRGPLFAQVVLADEINRTSPKTQSALLEAMAEGGVTVDGQTYVLPQPFFVLATENPVEFEGTFPLPEAQLDRFLFKFSIGYPAAADEVALLERWEGSAALTALPAAAQPEDVLAWRQAAAQVHTEPALREYIVQLVQATRQHPSLSLGASPRASLALYRAAQAWAYACGRPYVVPDDVRYLAPIVLAHRLILTPEAKWAGIQPTDLVRTLVESLPAPLGPGVARGRR